MWHLRTNGELSSIGLMDGLLSGLSQHKWFYNSMILGKKVNSMKFFGLIVTKTSVKLKNSLTPRRSHLEAGILTGG